MLVARHTSHASRQQLTVAGSHWLLCSLHLNLSSLMALQLALQEGGSPNPSMRACQRQALLWECQQAISLLMRVPCSRLA